MFRAPDVAIYILLCLHRKQLIFPVPSIDSHLARPNESWRLLGTTNYIIVLVWRTYTVYIQAYFAWEDSIFAGRIVLWCLGGGLLSENGARGATMQETRQSLGFISVLYRVGSQEDIRISMWIPIYFNVWCGLVAYDGSLLPSLWLWPWWCRCKRLVSLKKRMHAIYLVAVPKFKQ